ncbi:MULTISPECIES: hypothetical protein [Streptomycetaceae]|uniref:Helix-turn-helix domain-containing protein n=1 Tax=Streptantibioticus cattleyicolor (strain ATCC 35852 / DSM 46488 / JCM 4925 / NBRC 14057 / NRRL 8057) TaxID=1003195 RepID=F8JY73_STREN|nr:MULTISPECIES: hypothetical protein [Streptomycetaceae]AEW94652.1 hypothetical protein SCATT_22810 [Streptantibioticus cattleyicolor NRRL 8057 = DSM 46488]MYS59291.1 hypothetical protein [Streptomyces sp. SID5468]CCB75009.1 protein of unknown function [Streptantibioticus cattleyicolor NRRL 8057 = DSM 46488]
MTTKTGAKTRRVAAPAPPVDPAELRYYTPEEAVSEFRLPTTPRMLREWAYARKIPHNKLGGRIGFRLPDIRVLVERFDVPPLTK